MAAHSWFRSNGIRVWVMQTVRNARTGFFSPMGTLLSGPILTSTLVSRVYLRDDEAERAENRLNAGCPLANHETEMLSLKPNKLHLPRCIVALHFVESPALPCRCP